MEGFAGTRRGKKRLAIAGCCLALSLAGCQKSKTKVLAAAEFSVPVKVGVVSQRTVTTELREVGTVEPYATVQVKSQVDGPLLRADFAQGQVVHRGQLLFEIDRRPFETALAQAQANLRRDRATAEQAQLQAKRYAELAAAGIASREQTDQTQATAAAAAATVAADEAAIQSAKLQLGYTRIHSPIEGRTGALLVQPGNMVKTNDTALVVINQLQPVYVSFSVPQQWFEQVKRRASGHSLVVTAALPDDGAVEEGRLTFLDNALDTTTGTIRLKGTFQNGSERLWPGQFVDVRLALATQQRATVAPTAAIQAGQNGPFVYAVGAGNTVALQPIEAGERSGDETVIVRGLQPGQTVVTDGQLLLRPGMRVTVKNNTRD
jgi:multidrug efflux system membrane fusion protein